MITLTLVGAMAFMLFLRIEAMWMREWCIRMVVASTAAFNFIDKTLEK